MFTAKSETFAELLFACSLFAEREIQNITKKLESENSNEKKGYLTLTDDLKTPVNYGDDRGDAGGSQFPKTSISTNQLEENSSQSTTKETLLEEYKRINSCAVYDPAYVERRSAEIIKEMN